MGAALSLSLLAGAAGAAQDERRGGGDPADAAKTESPIKHVIILIGENRGTDHTFGVYRPQGKGQTISNLLSKGIVNEDGTPGPNFALGAAVPGRAAAALLHRRAQQRQVGRTAHDEPDAAAEHQRRTASTIPDRRAVPARFPGAGAAGGSEPRLRRQHRRPS